MKRRYNVFNLATAIVFLVAFILLMLSYITQIMFLPATVLFCAGFIMLSVALIKAYLEYQKTQKEVSDAIEMDAASGPDGAEYVVESEKASKKKRKIKRLEIKLLNKLMKKSKKLFLMRKKKLIKSF